MTLKELKEQAKKYLASTVLRDRIDNIYEEILKQIIAIKCCKKCEELVSDVDTKTSINKEGESL